MIFTTQYLPDISFFVEAYKADAIVIEACENFIKQTPRNRCRIYTANGPVSLTVYLEKCRSNNLPLKEVKISYTQAWNKIHWRTMVSAYNKSPFFMYYRHEFEKFYTTQHKFLLDYNTQILELCCKLTGITKPITFTEEFIKQYPAHLEARDQFAPAKLSALPFEKYPQVFDGKHGFIPNLSIIDLLCNRGPEAETYLAHHAQILLKSQP